SVTYAPVPGGERPQIHSLQPLVLTCDRIEAGLIGVSGPAIGIDLSPAVARFSKRIVFYDPVTSAWNAGALFSFRGPLLPSKDFQDASRQDQVDLTYRAVAGAGQWRLRYGTLLPMR